MRSSPTSSAGRLREGGRSPAGVAALRRAHGGRTGSTSCATPTPRGYHSDNHRDVSLYRDYVIDAFNTNKPFDQFTDRAARRRPAAERDRSSRRSPRATTACLQTTEEGGAQAEGVHGQVRRRPRAQRLDRLARPDAGLHRVPRPQVRSVHDEGVLQARRVLRRHPGDAGRPAGADADHDRASSRSKLKKLDDADRGAAKADRRRCRRKQVEGAAARSWPRVQKQKAEFAKTLPSTLVSTAGTPRMVRILPRGNWLDDSGEIVTPAVPASLPGLKLDARSRSGRPGSTWRTGWSRRTIR